MTGFWTAAEKLGLALGPGVAGLGLGAIGFVAALTEQAPQAVSAIPWLISSGAAGLTLLSLVPLYFVRGRAPVMRPV